MYPDTALMYPYFQNFCPEVQQFEDFYFSQKPNASMISTVFDYDLGAEGDLFKAPEPIIQEPVAGLDPITATISMISSGEDVMSTQALRVSDIESIQSEQLLSEVFFECEKDLLAQEAIETPLSEVLDIKIPITKTDENLMGEEKLFPHGTFQKSVSAGCLSSMEWTHGGPMRLNFLDFPGMDAYGLRRSLSEGDVKALGNGNVSLTHSPLGQQQIISNCTTEDRRQKLNRYRNKKSKRNFGRKIKYACRKALADSQPRIRGRFAKTDESDTSKRN